MNSAVKAAVVLLAGTTAFEITQSMRRFRSRERLFDLARKRAALLGRPLVVIGDPDTGMHTRLARAYDCGELCVDLTGCPSCPFGARVDLNRERIPARDGSAVVFISCTLELVEDLPQAWREILRVAGDRRNVFVAHIQPRCLTAWFYPGVRWRIEQAPPGSEVLVTPLRGCGDLGRSFRRGIRA